MRRRLSLLPLLLLLGPGCASHPGDPAQLELVRRTAPEEVPPPRLWRARLRGSVEGEAPLELWLPLPAAEAGQVVESLVVEVGPQGEYDLLEPEGGERVLHVSGPPPRLSAGWRATVTQRLAPAGSLPAHLRELPHDDPAAWVAAAKSRGLEARLVQGLVPLDDDAAPGPTVSPTVTRTWAELREGERWRAVEQGRLLSAPPGLRLGDTSPRAAVGGAAATPKVTADLTGD